MVFKNIQGDWTLDIPAEDTRVAIKISGGADSAIVTYMLAVFFCLIIYKLYLQ